MGSTGDVGSWFCSSVTSRFRNVVSRLEDDKLDEPLDELLPDVPEVPEVPEVPDALVLAAVFTLLALSP